MAEILARRGFVAMAVAYVGVEGLPTELERVPLEYVEHALTWLRLQPDVDPERVGVGGVSKGSELALLIASLRPEIHAVAAFAPSGVVFQSIATGWPRTSSWTYRGREIPFVPYGSVTNPKSTAELYEIGLQQTDLLERATIAVERINGPILLLSGKADNLWPSTRLADMVITRLREKRFAHAYEHIAYPEAGHLISSIRAEDVTRRGGTNEGNRKAQQDGQRRFVSFFEQNLRPGRR
jgi:dienelactone hydrolase